MISIANIKYDSPMRSLVVLATSGSKDQTLEWSLDQMNQCLSSQPELQNSKPSWFAFGQHQEETLKNIGFSKNVSFLVKVPIYFGGKPKESDFKGKKQKQESTQIWNVSVHERMRTCKHAGQIDVFIYW